MYMLGTILKLPPHFKAVRTVLKPSDPFQSHPDGVEAVGAKICGFNTGRPAGFIMYMYHIVRVHVCTNHDCCPTLKLLTARKAEFLSVKKLGMCTSYGEV